MSARYWSAYARRRHLRQTWKPGSYCHWGHSSIIARHWYATTLQDAGISPVEVTAFMGHSIKSLPVTFRVYGHVTEETFDLAREAIDRTLFRLRPVTSDGTVTELRAAQ
jgi:hypothetical protein